MTLFDAHCHFQDDPLQPGLDGILQGLPKIGVEEAVVDGSAETDWQAVADLAQKYAFLRPSFGLHPWYVGACTPAWKEMLRNWLERFPNAGVGEIGLDRWMENPDVEAQQECFRWQLELAAELDRPATIHCLRAWGLLDEALRETKPPARGFLIHSYGGPVEMIPGFAKLGAYFSLSPYFGHERKQAQLEVFAAVPADRILAESDAPGMWPPDELNDHPLEFEGKPVNHPANLTVSYDLLARVRKVPVEELTAQIAENYRRLFGT